MSLAIALGTVVDALQSIGVRYQVGGSVASSAHGMPRSTIDVDLVADLREDHVDPLCRSLRADFYAEPELVRMAIAAHTCVNFLHLESGYKVDVFVVGPSDYDRAAFARTVAKRLMGDPSGRVFLMTTAEDTVLRKLLWYRSGGEISDRQWSDILGVMRVQGDGLDREYLATWAPRLRIDDLLARAQREAER